MGFKAKFIPQNDEERELSNAASNVQLRVAAIRVFLSQKKYHVDCEKGIVYRSSKSGKKMSPMKPIIVHGGYAQFTFQGYIDNRFFYIFVYGHQLVWLVMKNNFPVKGELGFINGKTADFRYSNLCQNREAEDPVRPNGPPHKEYKALVRRPEMTRLRKMMREFPELRPIDASQALKCSYKSVLYAMNGIKEGKMLRYGGKYDRDPAKRIEGWRTQINYVDWMGCHYLE